ncbi:MAG: family 16 glycosylhydrolase [bacterium]
MEINGASSSYYKWDFAQAAQTIIGGLLSPAGCMPTPTDESCPIENNTPVYEQVIGPSPANINLTSGSFVRWEIDGLADYNGNLDLEVGPIDFHDPEGETKAQLKNSIRSFKTKTVFISHRYSSAPTEKPVVIIKGECAKAQITLPLPHFMDAGIIYYPDAGNNLDAASQPDVRQFDGGTIIINDAGIPDAAIPIDANIAFDAADAGIPDSSIADTRQPDAWQPDAADAGIPDAAIADAWQPDAWQPDAADAGIPDSAIPIDANIAFDAAPPVDPNALITWEPLLVHNMDEDLSAYWESSQWLNGLPAYWYWRPMNVSFYNGIMTLKLDDYSCPNSCGGMYLASGEYRTKDEVYGYGYYEARMKPARGNGLMAGSLFIYRGQAGLESHDEIDIEFLGNDCYSFQSNYFVEGYGGHEMIHQLHYNACEEFHNYGFHWSPNSIAWYVDGVEVRRADERPETPGHDLPYRPGKIMMNIWPSYTAWAGGPFEYAPPPKTAKYDWVKFAQ